MESSGEQKALLEEIYLAKLKAGFRVALYN